MTRTQTAKLQLPLALHVFVIVGSLHGCLYNTHALLLGRAHRSTFMISHVALRDVGIGPNDAADSAFAAVTEKYTRATGRLPLLCSPRDSLEGKEDESRTFDRRAFLGVASGAAAAALLSSDAMAVEVVKAEEDEGEAAPSKAEPETGFKFYGATDIRYFVAGGACAAASHGVTTPIDVVKTRMQAEPEIYDNGLKSATLSILNAEGPSALLGGLGPTVVGYGIEGAMKFGVYEALKPEMLFLIATKNPTLPYLASSVVAGAVASVILCPLESTRIRIVTDPHFAKGLMDGFPRLIREEGLLSTFSGVYAMLAKQVPYTMTKQVSFDLFASILYTVSAGVEIPESELKLAVSVCAAFLASVLSCIASHPGDVLLTETYKDPSKEGVFALASAIYKRKGIDGFFTGISARFLHVGTIITSQLVIYDFVKQLLGLPATGSH